MNCYNHCNHCGTTIFFKKEYDRWRCYEEKTGTMHRCMKWGTKTGEFIRKDGKKPNEVYFNHMRHFLDKVVIWEKDNNMVKQIKMKKQEKLRGWDGHSTYADRCKL